MSWLKSKTTWAGLLVLIFVGIDVVKNGVNTENLALASIAVGLIVAKDGETFKRA